MGRDKFSADFQLMFRLLKAMLFIGSVSVLAVLHFKSFTVGDFFASILAFIPTGWALLQVCLLQTHSNHVLEVENKTMSLDLRLAQWHIEYNSSE
jgi:hypothetical protein